MLAGKDCAISYMLMHYIGVCQSYLSLTIVGGAMHICRAKAIKVKGLYQ